MIFKVQYGHGVKPVKTIMSVGQCDPDHFMIAKFLNSNFECNIIRINSTDEAIDALLNLSVDYVLINRKLDIDYTDGILLIEKMKNDSRLKDIPVSIISNYPEFQEEAVKFGAIRGFGKAELSLTKTKEQVAKILNLTV